MATALSLTLSLSLLAAKRQLSVIFKQQKLPQQQRRCAATVVANQQKTTKKNKNTCKTNVKRKCIALSLLRWEEEKRDDNVKWTTLEHKGPVFAPPYERVPRNVRFFYDGKPLELSEESEEAATFYAKMLNHDYCTKDVFNNNFFKDFRKTMTAKEKEIIKDFRKCNFQEMHEFFLAESEKRKAATKEEKLVKKSESEALVKEYGFCMIDGHKEKIGNFRLEPPGLFRGRGEHPKMGMIKRRIAASDVSINCGKQSKVPSPPPGQRWKEVRHDNTVTWLASWIENVQGQVKYIMLNPSSKLKGEKDHIKYETARRLDKVIDKIRATYRDEWKSKEMRVRQRAVALYFIDKLALRAGNEKDEDQADTVGCCSLRVEHVQLHKELNEKENVVVFDFPGKDSIRYYNEVEVEKRVFKNLELFMENKKEGDDLFDRLNTQVLNEHLKELMDGKCTHLSAFISSLSIALRPSLFQDLRPKYFVHITHRKHCRINWICLRIAMHLLLRSCSPTTVQIVQSPFSVTINVRCPKDIKSQWRILRRKYALSAMPLMIASPNIT